ncbi:hypothetical protein [Polyangium mundeleinium]|uniref:Transporter n=1 Tax=Polyangium mundeleinium TaxID=2995306 RepID=A0ABT5EMC6_9BACT|nr:hypothetical protein [Polyangium mundeleinium]MDC0742995.1 hypothetical protein [Polyangium mundeleinium]
MTITDPVDSYRPLPAFAAIVLVLLSGARASAVTPPPVSARAGTARVDRSKPSGPTPMVQRGLILPTGLLDPYVSSFVERPADKGFHRFGASIGTLWGMVPEVHVDLQIGPYYIGQEPLPGTNRLTFTGRFVKTRPVDLGASFMTVFDPNPARPFVSYVQPGLPAILRPNKHLRIDTGVYVPWYPTTDSHVGVRVPLNVYVQIADRFHIGGASVLIVSDLRDPQATTSVPVGLTGGYSAGPELDFLALTPYVTWTRFYSSATGALDTRAFVAGLIADFIIDLR